MPVADPQPATTVRLALLGHIRGWLTCAIALQVAASVMVLAPLVGVAELAGVLLRDPIDEGAARQVVVWSAGALALGFGLRGAADLLVHLADNAWSLHVRRRVADVVARAPLAWFAGHSAEQVGATMRDDVTTMHHLLAHTYTDLANAAATVTAVITYLLWVDWRLALLLLLPAPAYAWLYRRMMAGSATKMGAYGAALADISDAVGTFVHGIAVIKSYGRGGEAHQAYQTAIRRFTDFFLGWARPLIRPETLAAALVAPVTLTLLVMVAGTALTAADILVPLELLPFLLLAPTMSAPAITLVEGARSLQLARGARDRITELLQIPPIAEPDDPRPPSGPRIELERVSFGYDAQKPVLTDVTATLEPGTMTALVGASGSGKSTLASLLLRYADPDAGTIRLGGARLDQVSAAQLYATVGAVFQDARLLRASARDNLTLARPDATHDQIVAAASAARIHDRILALPAGYDTALGEEIALSGGEAQRLSIARTLLLDPPVLILDEPTAAADVDTQHAIQEGVRALLRRDGAPRTVLVIAHRLTTVTGADQILVLDGGRLVGRGTHGTLLATCAVYRRMYDLQHASQAGHASHISDGPRP